MALSSRTVLATSLAAAFTAAAITIGGGPARSAEDAAVEARLQSNALAITAHATLRAPLPIIWDTLTDYDHLAAFVPGMKTSRVLQRHGGIVTVEQIGEASLWFFHFPIAVVVQSDEHYPTTIGVRVLTGNLKQLAGAYQIEPVSGAHDQFVLLWRGVIEPDIGLPLFIAAAGLREAVANQFLGMIREIERRGRLEANNRPE